MFAFYCLAAVVAVIMTLGALMVSQTPDVYLPSTVPQSKTLAPGLLAYREAAWQYLRDNPTSNGSLPSVSVAENLRVPIGNVSSYNSLVQGGWLYVWVGSDVPAVGGVVQNGAVVADQATAVSDGSRLVGYNGSGFLVSPVYGVSTIALPNTIPNGAPVAVRPLTP